VTVPPDTKAEPARDIEKNVIYEEAPWRAFRADAARVRRAAVAGMDAPQKADRCGQDAANREALLG
jgi:hypothetical protein